MASKGGLRRRIGRTFLLQTLWISIAAAVGVYLAGFAIEELLIKRALQEEADYYWQRWQRDPNAALPDTRNLTGYMRPNSGTSSVPASLDGLGGGFHHLATEADFSVVFVTERDGIRLYLAFDGERVNQLALYFGLAPLMAALAVVYLVTWLAYRASRRAVSPVVALAREVHNYDPTKAKGASFRPAQAPGEADKEVQALADALNRLSQRVLDFVERERHFTRDASHELRSPLTVIRIAAELLSNEASLDTSARKSVERIQRAALDMEELTEAFLLLARESDRGIATQPVSVNDVTLGEIDGANLLLQGKRIEVRTKFSRRITVETSEKVLSVLIGNLVRNAFSYTDAGTVDVTIEGDQLTIEDSGVGIDAEDVQEVFKPFMRAGRPRRGGHGVGLTIVKRLSDRFGWPVSIDSAPGRGTRVTVRFPQAASVPIFPEPAAAVRSSRRFHTA